MCDVKILKSIKTKAVGYITPIRELVVPIPAHNKYVNSEHVPEVLERLPGPIFVRLLVDSETLRPR